LALVLGSVHAGLAQGFDPGEDPALIGWWRCDEGEGSVVGDSSPNGNHGTFVNGDPAWTTGFRGEGIGIRLVGPTLVEVAAMGLTLTEATMAGWFLPNGTQPDWASVIMHRGPGPAHGFNFLGDRRLAYHWNDDAASWSYRGDAYYAADEWTHCAVTVEPDRATFYVNGKAESVNTLAHGPATWDGPIWLGGDGTSGFVGRRMNGSLDEVLFLSRALTEAEIASLVPPRLQAYKPIPADGTVGWDQPLFQWTKGDTAFFSNVYFGTDPENLPQVAANQPFELYFHPMPLEPGVTYYWRVDSVEVDMATIHVGDLWSFTVTPTSAWAPSPADEAEGVFPVATLAWTAGTGAVQHQVYFSSDRAAVADGAAEADQGVVDDPTWTSAILRSSSTYHWRVDQIQADGTVVEGEVWSFTTEAGTTDAAVRQWWSGIGGTAVSNLTDNENYPNNPSGSELVSLFEGPTDWADNYGTRLYGWLKPPQSGEYTFWIASDDNSELWLSTDEDPANAVEIASVPGWTPSRDFDNTGGGTGDADLQMSDLVTLQAGQKYFIQALQKEGGGGDNLAVAWQAPGGMREVIPASVADTFALPALTAFSPSPANGAVDTAQSLTLTWAAGENATQHDVYFGDDEAAVAAADTTTADVYRGRQSGTSYNPGALEWGKSYYWRIDEIETDGTIRGGRVWNFTTAEFIPVDDMEIYTNDSPNRIFQTWIDGLGFTDPPPGNPGNGSASFVGHDIWTPGTPYTTIVETGTVQSGSQSLPLYVNNSTSPHYSETDRTFDQPIDMASGGVTDLSLWVHGAPAKFEETGPASVRMSGGGADVWGTADEFRFAYKRLSGNGSITVRVDSFDNLNAWTKVGVMIRESLDADAKNAMVAVTGSYGAQFTYRRFAGDISDDANGAARIAGITAPAYVKLTRTGDTFTPQCSTDGVVWQDFVNSEGTVITQDIAMTGSIYIGLAVLSHVSGSVSIAEYSEIAMTGATGQWQVEDVGVTQPGNTPDQLYVGLSSGANPAVVDVGEGPVLSNEWVQVKIPLADFAASGANLASVRQVIIGVGNRNNPVATGDGLIFIDNIRVLKPDPEPEPVVE
jgi:hypothetical protein